MYSYRPLTNTTGMDFRSTFTFSGQKKAPSNEAKYSDALIDMPSAEYINSSQTWIDFFCTSALKFLCYLMFICTFPLSAAVCFKLAHQYERIVLYRLGRLLPLKGPGLVLVLPCIDRWKKVDLRTKAFNIPPTRICTSDGCLVQIGGVIHFRVQNPLLSSNSVQDVNHSIRVIAQSAMSSCLSKKKLPEVMSSKLRYSYDIQVEINDVIREWGVEVGRVELTQPVVEMNATATLSKPQAGIPQMPDFGAGDGAMAGLAQFAQHFLSSQSDNKQPEVLEAEGNITPDELLNAAHMFLTRQLVHRVDATYEIRLTENNEIYYIDLKTEEGSCGKGGLPSGAEPDVTLAMSLSTLRLLFAGSLSPFSAYSSGRLKLQGDMKKAMKLSELIKCMKG